MRRASTADLGNLVKDVFSGIVTILDGVDLHPSATPDTCLAKAIKKTWPQANIDRLFSICQHHQRANVFPWFLLERRRLLKDAVVESVHAALSF